MPTLCFKPMVCLRVLFVVVVLISAIMFRCLYLMFMLFDWYDNSMTGCHRVAWIVRVQAWFK